MLLGRVTGTVVASRKEPLIEGWKLLVVRQLDAENQRNRRLCRGRRRGRGGCGRGRPLRQRQLRAQDGGHAGPALRRGDHGHRGHLGGRWQGGLPQVAAGNGGEERAGRMDEREIAEIIERVRGRVAVSGDGRPGPGLRAGAELAAAERRSWADGIHATVDDAVAAAARAFRAFGGHGLAARKVVIEADAARHAATTRSCWRGWPIARRTSAATRTRSSRTASSPPRLRGPRTWRSRSSAATTA